ncbi:XRE family transcriptional regulator [Afipia sp. TerB]
MKAKESPSMFFPMGKLGNRIRFVRKQAGLSQEKFAEALGTVDGVKVTRGAVGNWELGGGITLANLAAIADKFHVPLDWLESGKGDIPQKSGDVTSSPLTTTQKSNTPSELYAQNAYIGEPVRGFARIPIRGQGMGGKDGALIFSNDQNFGDTLAPPVLADVPDAYAVYVIGDSMLERFKHGEVVYVHPYMPVRKDDDCVVQISAGDGDPPHGFIKRFVSLDDKTLKLRQLNPKKVLTFPRERVLAIHRIVMAGPA